MWLTATLSVVAALASVASAFETCQGVCVSRAFQSVEEKLGHLEQKLNDLDASGAAERTSMDHLVNLFSGPPRGFFCPASRPQSCYMFVEDKTGWFEAFQRCGEMGSHLVFIEDQHEMDFLREQIDYRATGNDPWWIGASDMGHHGHYTWRSADGEKDVTYTFWDNGQPDDNQGKEHWAEIWNANRRWNDATADFKGGRFICEYDKQ